MFRPRPHLGRLCRRQCCRLWFPNFCFDRRIGRQDTIAPSSTSSAKYYETWWRDVSTRLRVLDLDCSWKSACLDDLTVVGVVCYCSTNLFTENVSSLLLSYEFAFLTVSVREAAFINPFSWFPSFRPSKNIRRQNVSILVFKTKNSKLCIADWLEGAHGLLFPRNPRIVSGLSYSQLFLSLFVDVLTTANSSNLALTEYIMHVSHRRISDNGIQDH